MMNRYRILLLVLLGGFFLYVDDVRAEAYQFGFAKVDVTPDTPVRLSGFAFPENGYGGC